MIFDKINIPFWKESIDPLFKDYDREKVKAKYFVIATGGIGHKNALFMQIYADILGVTIRLVDNENAVSVGSAIMAAITFKINSEKNVNILELLDKLSVKSKKIFKPNFLENEIYMKIYEVYNKLHNSFGLNNYDHGLFSVMKELKDLRKIGNEGKSL